jgi:hypothetical protein
MTAQHPPHSQGDGNLHGPQPDRSDHKNLGERPTDCAGLEHALAVPPATRSVDDAALGAEGRPRRSGGKGATGRPTSWIRAGFAVLTANEAVIGFWALIAPRSFFDSYPLGLGWVAMLPPFNEHLVRDVGALSVGFSVLFLAALVHPRRALVGATACAWLAAATPHLLFHLGHLRGLSVSEALGQSAGLILVMVIPIGLLLMVRHDPPRPAQARRENLSMRCSVAPAGSCRSLASTFADDTDGGC